MEQGLEVSDNSISFEPTQASALADPGANPFKLVVDPVMRAKLRRALLHLIESHDAQLAAYVSEDKLALESYKEYIELFARSLRETMESVEGIQFLLKSCGFAVDAAAINLDPEWRWKS